MNKDVMSGLAWAGGIFALAIGASVARHMGYIDSDTVTRLVVGINGLMIAWLGNRIPKTFVPSQLARRVHRIGGWSMVLSGIVYAALFAFAPIQTAVIWGCGAVLVGMLVTCGYCLWLRSKAKAA